MRRIVIAIILGVAAPLLTTHRIFVAAATFTPPPAGGAAPSGRGGRPSVVPDSFKILVIERQ